MQPPHMTIMFLRRLLRCCTKVAAVGRAKAMVTALLAEEGSAARTRGPDMQRTGCAWILALRIFKDSCWTF